MAVPLLCERRTAVALQARLGLSDEATVRLLMRHPSVLGYSFEDNVAPTIDMLQAELAEFKAPHVNGKPKETTIREEVSDEMSHTPHAMSSAI